MPDSLLEKSQVPSETPATLLREKQRFSMAAPAHHRPAVGIGERERRLPARRQLLPETLVARAVLLQVRDLLAQPLGARRLGVVSSNIKLLVLPWRRARPRPPCTHLSAASALKDSFLFL